MMMIIVRWHFTSRMDPRCQSEFGSSTAPIRSLSTLRRETYKKKWKSGIEHLRAPKTSGHRPATLTFQYNSFSIIRCIHLLSTTSLTNKRVNHSSYTKESDSKNGLWYYFCNYYYHYQLHWSSVTKTFTCSFERSVQNGTWNTYITLLAIKQ